MAEISSDLLKFNNTVSPAIEEMQNKTSTLASNLNDLIAYNKSAKGGIDSFYQSSKKASVLNAFDDLNSDCTSVIQVLTGDVTNILSECSSLKSKIEKLLELQEQIKLLTEQSQVTTDSAKKSDLQMKIYDKGKEFNELSEEAKTILDKLKSFANSSLVKVNSEKANIISERLTGRSFEAVDINVDGTLMRCYVYVPKYEKDVGKLPVMMYMYGMDVDNDHGMELMTYGGLGKLIHEGMSPSGIVVIPWVQNGRQYESEAFRNQLAKLSVKVAEQYNGDIDRISLGGTSYGAVTAYRLVNEHPGQFSAVVAAYGTGEITDAFRGVTVYNYTGRGGSKNTDSKRNEYNTQLINDIGGYATITKYDDTWNHTNVGTMAFSDKLRDENGNEISVVDAAMRIKRTRTS